MRWTGTESPENASMTRMSNSWLGSVDSPSRTRRASPMAISTLAAFHHRIQGQVGVRDVDGEDTGGFEGPKRPGEACPGDERGGHGISGERIHDKEVEQWAGFGGLAIDPSQLFD